MKAWFLTIVSILFSSMVMLGCSDSPFEEVAVDAQGNPLPKNVKPVDKETFSGAWPFVAESGYLRCDFGAIGFETPADKTVYALTARSADIAEENGLHWIALTPHENFWLNDPTQANKKISTTGLVNAATKLCD